MKIAYSEENAVAQQPTGCHFPIKTPIMMLLTFLHQNTILAALKQMQTFSRINKILTKVLAYDKDLHMSPNWVSYVPNDELVFQFSINMTNAIVLQ